MRSYAVVLTDLAGDREELARTTSPLYALGRARRERAEHPRCLVEINDSAEPERGDIEAQLREAVVAAGGSL